MLGYTYNAAGQVASLSQLLSAPVSPTNPNTAISSSLRTWLAGYASAGRLISFNRNGSPVSTAGFSYDANGNRTASTQTQGTQVTSRDYSVAANRLLGFGQTVDATSTSVVYSYGANGAMTADGLRNYTYDAEGRLGTATTGATDVSPTTRYAHNALGQRVFKTEPQYPPSQGDENDVGFMQSLIDFFTRLSSPGAAMSERATTLAASIARKK